MFKIKILCAFVCMYACRVRLYVHDDDGIFWASHIKNIVLLGKSTVPMLSMYLFFKNKIKCVHKMKIFSFFSVYMCV